jgi:hypothetical protein
MGGPSNEPYALRQMTMTTQGIVRPSAVQHLGEES